MTTEKKRNFIISVMYVAVIVVLAYFFISYALVWCMPFAIGLTVAVALQKPINWLHKKTRLPTKLISVFFVFLILSILGAIAWQLVYLLIREIEILAKKIPDLVKELPVVIDQIGDSLSGFFDWLPEEFNANWNGLVNQSVTELQNSAVSMSTSLGQWAATTAIPALPFMLINIIITIVACCFISMDYDNIANFIKKQFSRRNSDIISRIKHIAIRTPMRIARAYLIIASITFVELLIGFSLLRFKNAALLAILISIFDIMPVVGCGTIMIPWGIISIITGNVPVGIALLVMQVIVFVVRQFIEPRVVGDQLGLPPIVTLIAFYVGLQTFGAVGMFLFPLALIILKDLQESGDIKIWK